MVEKVEIGKATLYHGDCREIMPEIEVDALITDPVWPNVPECLLQGGDDPYGLFREICAAMPEIQRMAIIMRNDSDPRFLSAIPERIPFFMMQILQYGIPQYNGRKLGGIEILYGFGEPIKSKPGRRCISGISRKVLPQECEKVKHPCNRTIPHMEYAVNWWSDEGETVLDPCMGSGTTGIACMNLGTRKFIGIEIERRYFDIACARLTAAQDQQKLFAGIDG